uniref:Uncharacterized protein n=1 Tax=Globisporangium ultimum (strain ATCC 200006 / CBS 805.95 / DAOM BR144) TaxID=431595 RepID=K3WI33_GLOUD
MKRGKDAVSSPKSGVDGKKQQPQQHNLSHQQLKLHQHRQSLSHPFGAKTTMIARSQSMIDVITASAVSNDYTESCVNDVENPAFYHFDDRCKSVGACSVTSVLDNCVLQGGVHHTYMNVLTYLGSPLRVESCCYSMSIQWFRAFGEHDDFQIIPGACDEFFTATADDIGARILAKVMIEDEDVVKTKMLEYGPIKEDPEVRSKVEMYLERKSVLFMGLQSLSELWTLLIDDRRVRLTCESSLIPPFEALYTSDIKVEVVRNVPNEFCLHLAENCFVHLRAESNIVRDIIVLTLRAFRNGAVSNEAVNYAVSKGMSPMLTIRNLAETTSKPAQDFVPATTYNLPWNRQEPDPDFSDASSNSGNEKSPAGGSRSRASNPSPNGGGSAATPFTEEIDDSLLLDAEALIGNAMKMGIKNQILPRAPKKISIADIADLQIVDSVEASNRTPKSFALGSRDSFGYGTSSDDDEVLTTFEAFTEGSHGGGVTSSSSEGVTSSSGNDRLPKMDGDTIDDAIRNFHEKYLADSEIDAMKTQYTAIFCALQRELSESKKRIAKLSQLLDEKTEENASFRSDIDTLQSALTAVQIADKVNELVVGDLKQLVKRTSDPKMKPLPENFY